GVFTTLVRALGIPKVEVVELYDIEPWATDHLGSPIGLIFCFLYQKDKHRPREFRDSAGERLWFANQLCEDACASQALLNIVFNTDVEIGGTLAAFKADTMEMSPVMRGLAISNSLPIRAAHNALARYTSPTTRQRQRSDIQSADDLEETYHFIGYIPAHGKVWELDGLKPGPLEVGEMNYGGSGAEGWMDVVRPALRLKMKKYGGAEEGANIKFNLLALVNEQYCNASDELELAKRKRSQLERRLDAKYPQGWQGQVRSPLSLS
ncbi:cysteine proteinase, partial [Punctularia strigosozonata HHB-11173 SS5]|uniref:cysteine proteinase n=1 Tax=Punctularia strigosozonata (strain HHB-11173) TaxID=741275 RepID=UPI0004416917